MALVYLTATPNAAVDKTFTIPRFVPGSVHHVGHPFTVGGGKGINVARVIRQWDSGPGSVATTGFAGGHNGDFIVKSLAEMGLAPNFARIAQESRLCIALLESDTGVDSKINEVGPAVTHEECDLFVATVTEMARKHRYVALCGRIPPGARDTLYAETIEAVQAVGAVAALDTSGKALSAGLEAVPAFCKVNHQELGELVGQDVTTRQQISEAAAAYVTNGTQMIITMGAEGALWVNHGLYAASPTVQYVSAVGAGDAFLAAILVNVANGQTPARTLAAGVAAGASAAEHLVAGVIDLDRASTYARDVEASIRD